MLPLLLAQPELAAAELAADTGLSRSETIELAVSYILAGIERVAKS